MRSAARATLLIGAVALLQGCLTAHYVVTSQDADVRMSGRHENEAPVRHVEVFLKKHHFLFGTIPNKPEIDVAKAVGLQPGEALVNLKIDEGFPSGHYPVLYGLLGLAWPVWNPHAVMISGDIVKVAPQGATVGPLNSAAATLPVPPMVPVPAVQPTTAPTPSALAQATSPSAPLTPGRWQHLHGTYTQDDAERACASLGAELPTMAQLKAGKDRLSRNSGDLWTSERQGDDGWIFTAASGATFLKNSGDAYGAYCREKGS